MTVHANTTHQHGPFTELFRDWPTVPIAQSHSCAVRIAHRADARRCMHDVFGTLCGHTTVPINLKLIWIVKKCSKYTGFKMNLFIYLQLKVNRITILIFFQTNWKLFINSLHSFNTTTSSKLQWLQYRINHRTFTTKVFWLKIGK